MYAITDSGWRAVTDDSTEADLNPGETLVEELPQWLFDVVLSAQAIKLDAVNEDAWRYSELVLIADQLIALEDGDPSALPYTEQEWRNYRTKVRAWKEGAESFPDSSARPVRPS